MEIGKDRGSCGDRQDGLALEGDAGQCPRCGAALVCGARMGQCWCMARPPLGFDPGYGRCLCADCLAELARQGRPDAPLE